MAPNEPLNLQNNGNGTPSQFQSNPTSTTTSPSTQRLPLYPNPSNASSFALNLDTSRPESFQTSALNSPTGSLQTRQTSPVLNLPSKKSTIDNVFVPENQDYQSRLVSVRLMDGSMLIPRSLLNYRAFLECIHATSDQTVFLEMFSEEMKLFLHWSKYGKVPVMTPAQTDSLLCLAKERDIPELYEAVQSSKDHRAMNREQRDRFDGEIMRNMEGSLSNVILWPQPSRPGPEGEGTNAATLSTVTYKAFTQILDEQIWDLPIGQKKMLSLEFRFPLTMQRPFALSVEGNDQRREELGQPGWDNVASSSSGRCAIWNCYRADPGRQIWHRVFFDSIAKRLYRDGFEIEREFFDVVASKTHYLLSH